MLLLLLLQTPDAGWGPTHAKPQEVHRIYWELQQTTEVLVRLVPLDPDGKAIRVNLVFHAFFPGRPERDPYSGLPKWPTSAPVSLAVIAEAWPLTFVVPELSLRFEIGETRIDLTAPGGRYRNIPCRLASEGCSPDGVEADIGPDILRSLIRAPEVHGQALGFPFKLTQADQSALAEFASRIGLPADASGFQALALRDQPQMK